MNKVISLGSINIKIINPILVSIFCLLHSLLKSSLINENEKLKAYSSIDFFIYPFSEMLCVILSLISNCLFNKAKEEKNALIVKKDKKEIQKINILHFSFIRITNKTSFPIFLFFILCLCYIIFQSMIIFFISQVPLDWTIEITKTFHVLSTALLSFIILHIKVYRHNYFSIFLLLICSIIIAVWKYSGVFEYNVFLASIIAYFIYGLIEVIEKYIMNKTYMSPYTLLFFEGCFNTLSGIIMLIILNNIECRETYTFCNNTITNTIFDIKQFLLLTLLRPK